MSVAPFQPPSFLAVLFYGFAAERPGNRIFLRCVDTNASVDVAVLRTNTQWATAYVHIALEASERSIARASRSVSSRILALAPRYCSIWRPAN